MRKATYAKRAVKCDGEAVYLDICSNYGKLSPGDFFEYKIPDYEYPEGSGQAHAGPIERARMVARIVSTDSDGEDCKGWILALQLGSCLHHGYVRWINPEWVIGIRRDAGDFLRWFAMPREEWVRITPGEMCDLSDYGTLADTYIGHVPERLAALRTRQPRRPTMDPRSERAEKG